MPPTNETLLETPIDGLHATPAAPLPFMSTTHVRAFLLDRAQGNLIVYNAPGLTSTASEIRALGGAARQLINHAHEAMFGPQGLELGVFAGETRSRRDCRIATSHGDRSPSVTRSTTTSR